MESLRYDQIHQNDTTSSPSPEMFSFPGTPTDDQSESKFEFGSCVTPDSPTLISNDLTKHTRHDDFSSTSPADQFFLNGRLLPHDFPVQTTSSTRTSFSGREHMGTTVSVTLSRGASAGSNRSSKDYSLVSSRSNSTNSSSRGSTCSTCTSSARASSSEGKTFHGRMHSVRERSVSSSPLKQYYKYASSGSSQRWQFITAVPVLGHSQSRRGRRDNVVGSASSPRMMKVVGNNNNNNDNNNNNNNNNFLYRMLRSVVATCKACHAMEGQEKEFELDAVGDVLGH